MLATMPGQLAGIGAGAGRAFGSTFSASFGPAIAQAGMLMSRGLILAGAAAGTGIAVGLYKSATGAADLAETVSKVGVVFGDQAKIVTDAADEMARRFKVPKGEFLEGAASLGRYAQAAKKSNRESAQFGVTMVKLAMDLGSIENIDTGLAIERLSSAMSGEIQVLRRHGALLSEETTKQEAYRMGIAKTGAELTEGQKITARASQIQRDLAQATGDLERTFGSAKNQQRAFWGGLKILGDTVGESLAPAWAALLRGVNGAMDGAASFYETNKAAITEWSTSAATSIDAIVVKAHEFYDALSSFMGTESGQLIKTTVGAVFVWLKDTLVSAVDTIIIGLRNWADITEIISLQIAEKWMNIAESIHWFQDSAGEMLNWFGRNFPEVFRDAFAVAWAFASNALTNIKDLFAAVWEFMTHPGSEFQFNFTPLLDGFKSTIKELPKIAAPALSSLQGQIDAVTKRIAGAELKRAEEAAAKAKLAAGGAAAVAGGGKGREIVPDAVKDKRKPEFLGFEEFAKKLQLGAIGKADAAQRTADGVGKLVNLQEAANKMQQNALKPKGAQAAIVGGPA
jgi:hypothetical protein